MHWPNTMLVYTNPKQYYWDRYSRPSCSWPILLVAVLYGLNAVVNSGPEKAGEQVYGLVAIQIRYPELSTLLHVIRSNSVLI